MIRAPSADEPGEKKKKVHDRNQREEEEETGRKKNRTKQNTRPGRKGAKAESFGNRWGGVGGGQNLLMERKHPTPVTPVTLTPPTSFSIYLFCLMFHRGARLTFKVQEKVWIVLYFPC